jgi:hypothetical protein
MCFLALLTFTMAMLVCIIWTVPGIFTDTLIIAPNDTVMAAYQIDTRDTDNVLYTLSSLMGDGEASNSNRYSESLVVYNGTCSGLKASSVEVHINDSVDVSAEIERISVSRLYLVADSTLDYIVKLSLSSGGKAPSDCFATLQVFNDYFNFKSFLDSNDTSQAISSYNFCNNSTINFTLVVKDKPAHYYFFALYTANRGQVTSVNIQASGTIFYYDIESFLLNKVCHLVPPTNSSCKVQTGHQTDNADVCLLITRGTPYIPGTDPDTDTDTNTITTVAVGNDNDDIIQFERKRTTYWGLNRAAVFVCLFVPLLISCCVLTILTPRRANYGSYIWISRKKPLN